MMAFWDCLKIHCTCVLSPMPLAMGFSGSWELYVKWLSCSNHLQSTWLSCWEDLHYDRLENCCQVQDKCDAAMVIHQMKGESDLCHLLGQDGKPWRSLLWNGVSIHVCPFRRNHGIARRRLAGLSGPPQMMFYTMQSLIPTPPHSVFALFGPESSSVKQKRISHQSWLSLVRSPLSSGFASIKHTFLWLISIPQASSETWQGIQNVFNL